MSSKTLSIAPKNDLWSLEEALWALEDETLTEVTVKLPRNLGRRFFRDGRLVALFASAAQRCKLSIEDTHHVWNPAETTAYLRSSLRVLAACTYAKALTNVRSAPCPLTAEALWAEIGLSGGLLENNPAAMAETGPILGGTPVTFCARDPDYSEPGLLAGFVANKDSFIKWFLQLKLLRDLVGRLSSAAGASPLMSPQWRFAEFVYELFSNTFEHGNKGRGNSILSGLRYLSFQKHVATTADQMKRYAENFRPLEAYLDALEQAQRPRLFCEVSIGDQGLGIVEHFVQARPEYANAAAQADQRLYLLYRLLRESLTSKRHRTGAGGGLQNVLSACRMLNAFVTVRTDRYWLYSSFPPGQENAEDWKPVEPGKKLARVSGTHFSALLPLDGKQRTNAR